MATEHFLLLFLLLLTVGTLCVTGWFFITRGHWELQPDGTYRAEGRIFKHWTLFWNMEKKEKKKLRYTGMALIALYNAMRKDLEQLLIPQHESTIMTVEPKYLTVYGFNALKADVVLMLELNYDVKIVINDSCWVIYKEETQYYFPELIRSPLANCATCFASVYGTIFYWGCVALTSDKIFAWSNTPARAALFFWVVFCMCLAVLNTALAKTFN